MGVGSGAKECVTFINAGPRSTCPAHILILLWLLRCRVIEFAQGKPLSFVENRFLQLLHTSVVISLRDRDPRDN